MTRIDAAASRSFLNKKIVYATKYELRNATEINVCLGRTPTERIAIA